MVKYGLAFATATEDMDGLTFGSKILLRHMTYSEAKKMPIKEYYIEKVLTELQLNMDEFIDLCILLGCDYCDTIKGIGPKKGLEYIQKYRNIETVLENLDKSDARDLFKNHEVLDPAGIELKWNEADEEGLVDFLVKEKSFNEERVRNGAKKLLKSRTTSTQGRIDTFFTVSSSSPATKRKVEEKEVANKKKAGKGPAKSSFKGKK